MITIKQIRGTRNYFENYLSQNEFPNDVQYHSEDGKIVGRWCGKMAQMLGIEGEIVTAEHFTALADNKHPITGEKLRQRSAPVKFHDVVISAPKSYSVAALVGKDERLIAGFRRAVEKTFLELEKQIGVRVRSGNFYNSEKSLTTGNGAAAVFLHDDNRLLDPQLHMHLVFSNHSYCAERGGYYAMQPKMMMDEAKAWITDFFHRELGKEAIKAGYKTDLPNNRLGLTGVGLKAEYIFSKRAQHRRKFEKRYRNLFGSKPDAKRIEHFIKDGKAAATKRFQNEYQGAFGHRPSDKLVDSFVVDWRTQKKKDIGDATKHSYQRSQLKKHGAAKLDELVKNARSGSIDELEAKIDEVHQSRLEIERARNKLFRTSSDESENLDKEDQVQTKNRKQSVAATRKKKPHFNRGHEQAIRRTEVLRRMKRGMAVAQALRGHPMVFMLQQISTLSQNRR